jgi:hypothetical protein
MLEVRLYHGNEGCSAMTVLLSLLVRNCLATGCLALTQGGYTAYRPNLRGWWKLPKTVNNKA